MSYTLTVGTFKLTIAETQKVTFYVDTDFQAISAEAKTAASEAEAARDEILGKLDIASNRYRNPQDAINNGVNIGDLWLASENNTMGAIPGTIIMRYK